MNKELLAECGSALYGAGWQSQLAREVGVSARQARRWAAGTTPVPDLVAAKIQTMLETRAALCAQLTVAVLAALPAEQRPEHGTVAGAG